MVLRPRQIRWDPIRQAPRSTSIAHALRPPLEPANRALSDGARSSNGSIDKTDGKDLSRIIEALGGQYTRWNAESLRRGPCLPELLVRGAFSQTPLQIAMIMWRSFQERSSVAIELSIADP
jgi:hypothetical protein